MFSRILPIALTLCIGFASGMASGYTARAAEPASVQVVVPTDDINLRTAQGANLLMRRIERAARVACGGPPELRKSGDAAQYQTCVADAVARAGVAVVLAMKASSPRITVLAEVSR
ncbi:MAG: UrcA family protein [Phenylobacterium sp.]